MDRGMQMGEDGEPSGASPLRDASRREYRPLVPMETIEAADEVWMFDRDHKDGQWERVGEGAVGDKYSPWNGSSGYHLVMRREIRVPEAAPAAPEPAPGEGSPSPSVPAQPGAAAPVPMLLHCPSCRERHVDAGKFATKPHHTHACQSCGMVWRPAIGPTVGVQFLPGFKDSVFASDRGEKDPCAPSSGPSQDSQEVREAVTRIIAGVAGQEIGNYYQVQDAVSAILALLSQSPKGAAGAGEAAFRGGVLQRILDIIAEWDKDDSPVAVEEMCEIRDLCEEALKPAPGDVGAAGGAA